MKFWLGNLKKGENFENRGIDWKQNTGIKMGRIEIGCRGVRWMQLASVDVFCVYGGNK